MITTSVLAGLIASSTLGAPTGASDWPQWRGRNRDGVAVGAELPETWPEKLPVRWRVATGRGYSSPVVAGGRVYIMERADGAEVVRSLDVLDGATVWRHAYALDYTVHRNAGRHGNWPKATTTVTGGRVFSFGISGVLTALNAETGVVVWKRDLGAELKCMPTFGVAASPLVENDLVILPVGDEANAGAIMAFRAADGKTAWRSVRDGPSYASPIAADLAGIRQVVTFTANHLAGVALADGKELWTYPFKLPWNETIVTPLVWKGMVVCAGRNRGGTRLLAVRRRDGTVVVEEVWKQDAPVYMSSPVIRGDAYFAVEHRTGRLFCLKLADGSLAWKAGTYGDYASLVLAGDRILMLDSKGTLTVFAATASAYREVASIRVADTATYAHLVVVGSRLYVRSSEELVCFDVSLR
jgi:outer membrane protein assembly factor BamB